MKKRTLYIAFVLVFAISLILPVSAMATVVPPLSTGSFVINCTQVQFTGTVAAGEQVKLTVQLHSSYYFYDPFVQNDNLVITAAGPYNVTVPWVQNPDGLAHRVVIQASTDNGASWQTIAVQEDRLSCPPPPPPGGQGCTPGYWRNHTSNWPAPYTPASLFDTVFGVTYFAPSYTLGQAIWQGGGGLNVIARHGTAALLSAASSGVNYPFTVAQVIAMVKSGNIDPLIAANNLGCPLN